MHSGRAWASSTVSVHQGDRLLSRGLVLSNAPAPDLVRHAPPDARRAGPRPVRTRGMRAWSSPMRRPDWSTSPTRSPRTGRRSATSGSEPGSLGEIRRGQPGDRRLVPTGLIIGAALRPHSDVVSVRDAHQTISTGVISHTAHFHDDVDVGRVVAVRTRRLLCRDADASSAGVPFSHATAAWSRPSRRTAWRAGSKANSIRSRVCEGGRSVLLTVEPRPGVPPRDDRQVPRRAGSGGRDPPPPTRPGGIRRAVLAPGCGARLDLTPRQRGARRRQRERGRRGRPESARLRVRPARGARTLPRHQHRGLRPRRRRHRRARPPSSTASWRER